MSKMVRMMGFVLFISNTLMAQSVLLFPDSNAIWRDYYWYGTHTVGQQINIVWDDEIALDGDTVFNGYNYTKLNKSGWKHTFTISMFGTIHDSIAYCGYYGVVRTDSLKRVYFFASNDSMERLLYDFNLSVGDSLPLSLTYDTTNAFGINIVSSIDSVLINAIYHKRYNISVSNYPPHVSLIEGVGSSRGLFASLLSTLPIFTGYGWSTCFFSDSILSFNSTFSQSGWFPIPLTCNFYICPMLTGIENADSFNNAVTLFPNPTNSQFNIKSSFTIDKIEITDAIGQLIYRATPKDKNCIVQIEERGIYFVMVTSGDQRVVRKVMIER